MFKLEAGIQRLLNDLTPLLNKTSTLITGVQVRRGKLSFPCDVTALDGFVPCTVGDVWSEQSFDTYALFRFRMDLPQAENDTDLYLHITTNQGLVQNYLLRLGKVTSDSSNSFVVTIGNTKTDGYNAYVKACEKKGFTEDYTKADGRYEPTC